MKVDLYIGQVGQYRCLFCKPCGLMDQSACSVGSLIHIDFKDNNHPVVEKRRADLLHLNIAYASLMFASFMQI